MRSTLLLFSFFVASTLNAETLSSLQIELDSMEIPQFTATDCPKIEGRFSQCTSNGVPYEGELIVEMDQFNGIPVYHVQFPDPFTQKERRETFKMNGKRETRQEIDPETGFTLTVDSMAFCTNQSVDATITVSKFLLPLGKLRTQISKQKEKIIAQLTGNYLDQKILETITCEKN
jgi:hypothetical protein